MNRNDDQLIKQFMQTNKREIANNGFSRRVMNQLPISAELCSDILTIVCVISCCILFYVYDGISIILHSFHDIFLNHTLNTNNHLSLIAVIAILSIVCIKSIWTIKE